MPDAIGKGIYSYISSVKAVASEPVNREPISRRELGPTRSVEISISQEAINRRNINLS